MADNYIVISPAKDEEAYIERTIASMARQTVRPSKWFLVDDGSLDRTPAIIAAAAERYDWIIPVKTSRPALGRGGRGRKLGSAEIRAFQAGYEIAKADKPDFLVKLDTDLDLPEDYFERLLERFREDEKLGIASGVYLELHEGKWQCVKMPDYHAAGASKMIRRRCFEDIGGFPLFPGWDTADEIKAQARGWHTRHFDDIQFLHLRPEGSAKGRLKTHILHGEAYYAYNGGGMFLSLKFLHRLFLGSPPIVGAFLLLFGYLRSLMLQRPRLVNDWEAKRYRSLLRARMRERVGLRFNLEESKTNIRRQT